MSQTFEPLLDNILWCALSGPHVRFSLGTDQARRYAPGFSPILGFADSIHPRFDLLAPFCQSGEHFYCDRWSGTVPDGWRVDLESTMFKLVWNGAAPSHDEAPDAIALAPKHAAQALALAELTNPGPFGLRTIELGEYFGFFEHGQLIAMAGERMHAGKLREISGVCTHPNARGRGLAFRLMRKLLLRELQRGEQPFLHVMSENTHAHAMYLRMGFVDYRETVVRVVSRCA